MDIKKSVCLVFLLIILAACGFTSAATMPDQLHVTRIEQNHVLFLDRNITDVGTVQGLYKAISALPLITAGNHVCSYRYDGTTYHLIFLHNATSVLQADLDAGGCRWVHISKSDVRQGDYNNFFSLFLRSVGGA